MTSVIVKLVALLISLIMIISGCGKGDTEYNDGSAEVGTESSGEVSDVESLDESTEPAEDSSSDESIAASEDSSEDENSIEDSSSEVESNDVSEDSFADESSAEVSEPQPDVPNDSSSSAPENDTSKPAEDVSEPGEDISQPEEDTKPAECEHEYITAQKKVPTCTENGEEETYCKYCKLVKSSKGIQRLGHSFSDWIIGKEATADDEGVRYRTCFLCRYRETESIPKTPKTEISFTQADADYIANEFLRILNEKRAELGRQPLVTAPIAHQMATDRAVQISEHFSHTLPNGRDGARAICKQYQYNIANEDNCLPDLSGENIGQSWIGEWELEARDKEITFKFVAKGLINAAEKSYGHWYDLTNERYTACGVGVYIDSTPNDGGFNVYICIMTMDKLYGTDAT